MKSHYRNEAEWMADYNAMMAARETSAGILAKTQRPVPTPLDRKQITGRGITRSTPIPIRRPS